MHLAFFLKTFCWFLTKENSSWLLKREVFEEKAYHNRLKVAKNRKIVQSINNCCTITSKKAKSFFFEWRIALFQIKVVFPLHPYFRNLIFQKIFTQIHTTCTMMNDNYLEEIRKTYEMHYNNRRKNDYFAIAICHQQNIQPKSL